MQKAPVPEGLLILLSLCSRMVSELYHIKSRNYFCREEYLHSNIKHNRHTSRTQIAEIQTLLPCLIM